MRESFLYHKPQNFIPSSMDQELHYSSVSQTSPRQFVTIESEYYIEKDEASQQETYSLNAQHEVFYSRSSEDETVTGESVLFKDDQAGWTFQEYSTLEEARTALKVLTPAIEEAFIKEATEQVKIFGRLTGRIAIDLRPLNEVPPKKPSSSTNRMGKQ